MNHSLKEYVIFLELISLLCCVFIVPDYSQIKFLQNSTQMALVIRNSIQYSMSRVRFIFQQHKLQSFK